MVGDYVSYGTGLRRFGILSTAATRRSIVVQMPNERSQPSLLCTEPPPDAVEAYANAVSAAVSASQASRSSASLELARNFATSAAPMLYRTQGLQMLRDSQYHLCNMYLNNVLDAAGYQRLFREVMEKAADLIRAEMEAVKAAAARSQGPVTPPSVTLSRPGAAGTTPAPTPSQRVGDAGAATPATNPSGAQPGATPAASGQQASPTPRS